MAKRLMILMIEVTMIKELINKAKVAAKLRGVKKAGSFTKEQMEVVKAKVEKDCK